jgi:hypothetical protein
MIQPEGTVWYNLKVQYDTTSGTVWYNLRNSMIQPEGTVWYNLKVQYDTTWRNSMIQPEGTVWYNLKVQYDTTWRNSMIQPEGTVWYNLSKLTMVSSYTYKICQIFRFGSLLAPFSKHNSIFLVIYQLGDDCIVFENCKASIGDLMIANWVYWQSWQSQ